MATITGTAGNDTLTGTAGNDTISGLGGNDLVHAGSTGGTDVIDGGTGTDSIEFRERATSAVIVDFVAGTIAGGTSGTISFTNVERFVATNFNDRLSGNGSSQTLTGQGGADTLWGAGGIDTLWGGGGSDTFVFREMGTAHADRINDWASGSDKLLLDGSVMTALGATGNFAAGDARFKANSTGTATDASDRIVYNTSTRQIFYDADGNGSAGAQLIATLQSGATLVATDIIVEGGGGGGGGQTINGTAGNDSLVGGPGNDTIDGLAGIDTLRGGDGDDTLINGEVVDGAAGFDTEIMPGGIAGAGVERIILRGYEGFPPTDAHGNELDNIIIDEGPGVTFLYGNGGNDTLIGGSGVNYFVFEGDPSGTFDDYGQDSVDGGGGVDRLLFEQNEFAVTVDFRNGTVTGGSPVSASVTFTNIESAFGSQRDDLMFASDRGDDLSGYDGNDTVIGGAGDDNISGDSGFDHPPVNPGNDRLLGGGGNDGIGGEEGDDWIDGGAGNDDLFGDNVVGGGWVDRFAFTVAPGASNADTIGDFVSAEDLIVLDGTVHANSGASGRFAAGDARFAANSTGTAQDASDRVVYNTSSGELWYDADGNGAGSRQLIATLAGAPTLSAVNIEMINGGGGGGGGGSVINGTSGNDALVGTAGNDTINGLGGNDTLAGSGGTDFYDGGAGTDSLDFRSAATGVTVSFSGGTLSGGFSGTFASMERVLGSNLDDSLIGGAWGQNLAGQGGVDTVWGASGVDTLWGGGGADAFVFREMGSANADRISDWASGSDEVHLDDSAFTSIGALGDFAASDARFNANSTGTATDTSDRVVYNTSTGQLYYDADGSGGGARELIATFTGNPTVAATDFSVI